MLGVSSNRVVLAGHSRRSVSSCSVVDERTKLGGGVHRDANQLGLLRRNVGVDFAQARKLCSFARKPEEAASYFGVKVRWARETSPGVNSRSIPLRRGTLYHASAASGSRPWATSTAFRARCR